jgi:hypothetical protein
VNESKAVTQNKIIKILKKLRTEFVNFAVNTLQNEHLGRVKDIKLSRQGELHFIVARSNGIESSDTFSVSSRSVQQVDPNQQTIFIDQLNHSSMDTSNLNPTENLRDEVVRLLEEKLVVNRDKRKVGEVVVRKVVETRLVEVPVRREKLIIEEVGKEATPLAEIDLGKGEVTGVDIVSMTLDQEEENFNVQGEFFSVQAASDLLSAIALRSNHGCQKVRVQLVVDNEQAQQTYQTMFDSCRIS